MPSTQLQDVYALIERKRAEFGHRNDLLDLPKYRQYLGDWGLVDTTGLRVDAIEIGPVTCRWVSRDDGNDAVRVVYVHGGGYISGDWLSHGSLATALVRATGYSVLFVEYRLAPEHPYPAALEDALAAYRHALDHGSRGSGRAESVFVAGDSAGGGVAVSIGLAARASGLRMPNAIVAMGAFFNLNPETSSLIKSSGLVRDMAAAYVGSASSRDPLISQIEADLSGLPPVLLQVGSADYLLEDSELLFDRLKAVGVDATYDLWSDMPHVWQKFEFQLPEARQAFEVIAKYLARHCQG